MTRLQPPGVRIDGLSSRYVDRLSPDRASPSSISAWSANLSLTRLCKQRPEHHLQDIIFVLSMQDVQCYLRGAHAFRDVT